MALMTVYHGGYMAVNSLKSVKDIIQRILEPDFIVQ